MYLELEGFFPDEITQEIAYPLTILAVDQLAREIGLLDGK